MLDGMYSTGSGVNQSLVRSPGFANSGAIVFNELQTSLIFMMQAGLLDRNYNNC
jgi:hypothetical protein